MQLDVQQQDPARAYSDTTRRSTLLLAAGNACSHATVHTTLQAFDRQAQAPPHGATHDFITTTLQQRGHAKSRVLMSRAMQSSRCISRMSEHRPQQSHPPICVGTKRVGRTRMAWSCNTVTVNQGRLPFADRQELRVNVIGRVNDQFGMPYAPLIHSDRSGRIHAGLRTRTTSCKRRVQDAGSAQPAPCVCSLARQIS